MVLSRLQLFRCPFHPCPSSTRVSLACVCARALHVSARVRWCSYRERARAGRKVQERSSRRCVSMRARRRLARSASFHVRRMFIDGEKGGGQGRSMNEQSQRHCASVRARRRRTRSASLLGRSCALACPRESACVHFFLSITQWLSSPTRRRRPRSWELLHLCAGSRLGPSTRACRSVALAMVLSACLLQRRKAL